eukprot:2646863-Rhodomonas_salina.1
MLSCDYVLPESLHDEAVRMLNRGQHLQLEYDFGYFTPIYNEHELSLACRMVSESHNRSIVEHDDD